MDKECITESADVLVIAGTADAREIIIKLIELGITVGASVTTAHGHNCLPVHERLLVFEGSLDADGMAVLLENTHAVCLVDASHPYAEAASLHAKAASRKRGLPYLRFERPPTVTGGLPVRRVPDFKTAALVLCETEGNILLTIGSRHLDVFTATIPDYKTRLFVRVLPDSKVLTKCEQLGLGAQNIIAIQGPFTEAMNIEMLKYCQARILVTKDSGRAGGTWEKLSAAQQLAIPALLIDRPGSTGETVSVGISGIVEQVQICLQMRRNRRPKDF